MSKEIAERNAEKEVNSLTKRVGDQLYAGLMKKNYFDDAVVLTQFEESTVKSDKSLVKTIKENVGKMTNLATEKKEEFYTKLDEKIKQIEPVFKQGEEGKQARADLINEQAALRLVQRITQADLSNPLLNPKDEEKLVNHLKSNIRFDQNPLYVNDLGTLKTIDFNQTLTNNLSSQLKKHTNEKGIIQLDDKAMDVITNEMKNTYSQVIKENGFDKGQVDKALKKIEPVKESFGSWMIKSIKGFGESIKNLVGISGNEDTKIIPKEESFEQKYNKYVDSKPFSPEENIAIAALAKRIPSMAENNPQMENAPAVPSNVASAPTKVIESNTTLNNTILSNNVPPTVPPRDDLTTAPIRRSILSPVDQQGLKHMQENAFSNAPNKITIPAKQPATNLGRNRLLTLPPPPEFKQPSQPSNNITVNTDSQNTAITPNASASAEHKSEPQIKSKKEVVKQDRKTGVESGIQESSEISSELKRRLSDIKKFREKRNSVSSDTNLQDNSVDKSRSKSSPERKRPDSNRSEHHVGNENLNNLKPPPKQPSVKNDSSQHRGHR